MKKLFFAFVALVTMATSFVFADGGGNPLPIVVKPINPGGEHTPFPKSPVQVPTVYQDGNVLTFDSTLEGCTILLLDEDENIVYSHFIAVNETSAVLPSTLAGTYELQIVAGDITFWCYIEL